MKRIGNIYPTLMNIHNNQLKILHVHTKEFNKSKGGPALQSQSSLRILVNKFDYCMVHVIFVV